LHVCSLTLLLFLGISSGCAILPGHWRPGWNQPWPEGAPIIPTAASWALSDEVKQDARFVGLAISGGGSRAANFGAAVMLELQQRGLLKQVDVISAVSGGTLPAVYYGLADNKVGPFTEGALRKALGYNFQGSWIRRWFLPHNIFRFWLSDFTRSDIMVQVFNRRLYHEATFADLRPYPKILLNSTVRNDHTRFTFTDDRFESLHSILAKYQVANAVNASSAFPGAFDDVTLQKYVQPPQYLHLYDGGPIDNLGVQALLEYLNRNLLGKSMDSLFPNGCVIFVVDATPVSEEVELGTRQSSRTFLDYFVNTNALDAADTMLTESRRSLLALLGIPSHAQDQQIRGVLPLNDRNQCGCEVRHIALRHILYGDELPGDPEFGTRVTGIKTKFWVSEAEQADLYAAARLIMKELDEAALLPGPNMKIECARQAQAHR
jgi:predicted acylesterase/phospholipase RssA